MLLHFNIDDAYIMYTVTMYLPKYKKHFILVWLYGLKNTHNSLKTWLSREKLWQNNDNMNIVAVNVKTIKRDK